MRVRWMLAGLAATFAIAAGVAAAQHESLFVFAMLGAATFWLAAVVIAGVLLVPVALMQRSRPPTPMTATAVVIGGLLVFPVHREYVYDRDVPGTCGGLLPLAEAVENDVSEDPHARIAMSFGCED